MFSREMLELAYFLIIFSGFASIAVTVYILMKIACEIYWYLEDNFVRQLKVFYR